MDIVVIETITENGSEWGLSFNGPNPRLSDYFKMTDKPTAFRLRERLMNPAVIGESTPSSCPVNCDPSDYQPGGKCDQHGCYTKEEEI